MRVRVIKPAWFLVASVTGPTPVGSGCGSREAAGPFGELEPFVGEDTHGYVVGQGHGQPDYQIHVFFEANGEAVVFYDEGILGHGFTPLADRDQPSNRIRIDTTWSIAAGELFVDDVMRCVRVEDDPHDRTMLSCTLQRVIASEQTLEAVVRMFPGLDPKSLEDPAFADFESE